MTNSLITRLNTFSKTSLLTFFAFIIVLALTSLVEISTFIELMTYSLVAYIILMIINTYLFLKTDMKWIHALLTSIFLITAVFNLVILMFDGVFAELALAFKEFSPERTEQESLIALIRGTFVNFFFLAISLFYKVGK